MGELRFHFSGDDAAAAAEALDQFCQQELGRRPEQRAARSAARPAGQPERSDPVALAALILAIPAAALATWDLAERMRLEDKVERMLALLRAKNQRGSATVSLEQPDGRRVPIGQVSAAQILDAGQAGEPGDARPADRRG